MKKLIVVFIVLTSFLRAGTIQSDEHEFFTIGFRIAVKALIDDAAGIYEARVYFKRDRVKDYQVFSQMECMGSRCYAEIPLTSVRLRKLNYVIVYQNSAGSAFKSSTYTMEKRDLLELPSWQSLNKKEMLLYTEYAKAPKSINGFMDNMKIQKSSEDVLGVAVGLYSTELINPKVEFDCSQCKAIDLNSSIKKSEG